MPELHHHYGGSGAHRWINCPASIKQEFGLPNVSSEAALEGTVAHKILELCLVHGFEPHKFIGFSFDNVLEKE